MPPRSETGPVAPGRILLLLSVASFFDGYDSIALSQLLPTLQAQMDLSRADVGALAGFVNVGSMIAYFLVRAADRRGRRPMLTLTILGYTAFTVLTGFAPNVWAYGILQLCARTFLVAEGSIAIVYAVEEFPAARRSTLIGVLNGAYGLGTAACALLVPVLLSTRFGWRSVYLIGALPLLVMARARHDLRETRRFTEQVGGRQGAILSTRIFRSPSRGRMLQLALIWALTYACTGPVVTFWKEAAVTERRMTDAQVGFVISIAAAVAIPTSVVVARLVDLIGRRRGALVAYGLLVAGTLGGYGLQTRWQLVASLTCAIVGVSSVSVVLASYTTELFPTNLRADAFAWANHLLGRAALILSPFITGRVAQHLGWARTISSLVIFPVLALTLILLLLPETTGRELEETSLSETSSA